jgi:hypothetical protein
VNATQRQATRRQIISAIGTDRKPSTRRKSSTTDLYRLMMAVRTSDEPVDLQGGDVRRQALSRLVQACAGAVSTPRIHPEYLA